MVTTVRNGVTLSAHAVLNGARNPVLAMVRQPRDSGDFADTATGRQRREARRNKAMQRSFFAGL